MKKNLLEIVFGLFIILLNPLYAQEEGGYSEAVSEIQNFEIGGFGEGGAFEFGSVSEGVTYALIIGVNDYQDDKINKLTYPVEDAENLRTTLLDIYNFSEDYTHFLKNPTRKDLIDELDRMVELVNPQDNLLIFYAGHGFWDEERKNGYWFPADAKMDDKSTWFRNSTLRDYMSDIHSKHTLIIVDACFSGGIFEGTRALAQSEDASAVVKELYGKTSRRAITSGALEEVADDGKFMKFFIRTLEENLETHLPARFLFNMFSESVINNTDQLPQYGAVSGTGDEGGDFIFVRKK